MNNFVLDLRKIFIKRSNIVLLAMFLLILLSVLDGLFSGLRRRVFFFYNQRTSLFVIEERLLPSGKDIQDAITVYVADALLGPMPQGLQALFPRETRLEGLLYRSGIVYVSLSEEAAAPVLDGVGIRASVGALEEGIRRNFSNVTGVHVIIGGNEPWWNGSFSAESSTES